MTRKRRKSKSKRKGVLVTSGCPRSGTSVCMDVQAKGHGRDMIIGAEQPQEDHKQLIEERKETNELTAYLIDKQEQAQKELFKNVNEDENRAHDMNPKGFNECFASVSGLVYNPEFEEVFKKIARDLYIMKIVSSGLLATDPHYIDRIIYMIRHPRAVAKSQERLERTKLFHSNNNPDLGEFDLHQFPDGEKMKIHNPILFINSTLQFIHFSLNNRDIPLLLVAYDDLIYDTETQVKRMFDFSDIPDPDFDAACGVIEKDLDRSKIDESIEHPFFEDAEYLYEQLLKFKDSDNDYTILEETVESWQDPTRKIQLLTQSWPCYRLAAMVKNADCELCILNPKQRLKMRASRLDLDKGFAGDNAAMAKTMQSDFTHFEQYQMSVVADDYSLEPCAYECGKDVFRKKFLTINQSMFNNHWVTGEEIDLEKVRAEDVEDK